MAETKKAIVLSSGGIDSTTVMAIANNEGFQIYSLSFFYGQRHAIELECAKKLAKSFNVIRHLVINVDLKPIGGSALTDDIEVPKNIDLEKIKGTIPVTYVPARNTIFLSFALIDKCNRMSGDAHTFAKETQACRGSGFYRHLFLV